MYAFLLNYRKHCLHLFCSWRSPIFWRKNKARNLLNAGISRTANSASLVLLCNIGSITVFITATKILHSKPFLSGKNGVRVFRLIFYYHLFVPCDLEENIEPMWRGKGLVVVVVVVVLCGELKISEANMSGRIPFLLELMLLLDKTDSSGVTQVLLKFRNKFQDKVWGKGLRKPMWKAFG